MKTSQTIAATLKPSLARFAGRGFQLLLAVLALGLFVSQSAHATTYYSPTSGTAVDPTSTNNWWTGTGGTGSHPANFTSGDTFVIQNNCTNQVPDTTTWTVNGTANGTATVQINSGGCLRLGAPSGTSGTLQLSGNFVKNGNLLSTTGFNSGGSIFFNSTSGTSFTWTGSGDISGDKINVTVNAGVMLDASGMTNGFKFNAGTTTGIAVNGTLKMGTNTINGNNTTSTKGYFTLGASGTLITAHTNGLGAITGATATGTFYNFNTLAKVTLPTTANYQFNGASAQITGTNLPATVNNLTIYNAAGVTLSQSTTVSGTFSLGTNATMGTLTVTNTLTQAATGKVLLRLNKTAGTLTNDLIKGTGSVTYGGTLTVTNTTSDTNQLALGDSVQLFNVSSSSGTFATVNLPSLSAGLVWNTSGLTNNGTIVVAAGTPAPVFNPAAGGYPYVGALSVTVSSVTNSEIYYTTDGSDPMSSGTVMSNASPATVVIPANTPAETIIAYASRPAGISIENSATYSTIATQTWSNPGGGNWSTAGNWSNNIVGSGANVTADFSKLDITGNTTVALDTPVTIGNLIFDDTVTATAGSWVLTNNSLFGNTLTLQGTNPVVTVSNNASIYAVVAGTNGLTKTGPGGLWFFSANTYSGGTILNQGTLWLYNTAGSLGTGDVTVNSGTIYLKGYNTLSGASPANTVTIGGVINNNWGQHCALNKVVLNGGNLYVSSVLDTTYGDWVFNNTIYATNGWSTSQIQAGNAALAQTGGTVFNVGASDKLTVSTALQHLSGSADTGLIKTGAGLLNLSGANTYTGATTVSNGTLLVSGAIGSSAVTVAGGALGGTGSIGGAVSVQNGGTLFVGTNGATGTLTVTNALTLASGSTVLLQINKTGGTPANDLIQGLTSLACGSSTLTVTNITSDATPLAAGDSFQLFNTLTYSGGFGAVNLPALPDGLSWDTAGLTVNGTILVVVTGSTLTTPTPAIYPPGGNYLGTVPVTIWSEAGATIYYTTDGSDPTVSGTVMSNSSPATVVVPVNTNLVITAYAVTPGKNQSGNATATYATLVMPTWVNTGGGAWSTAGNWSNNIVGSGANITADFSELDLTADTTVSLDTPVVIGSLLFADTDPTNTPANWIVDNSGNAANTLTLQATNPTVTLSNSATISAVVAGTNGLTKTGAGSLFFYGDNTYTGGTTVNQGAIFAYGANTAKGRMGNGNITVNSGGTIWAKGYNTICGSSPANVTTINSGGKIDNNWGQNCNLNVLVLNGGTLNVSGGVDAAYGDWSFRNVVYATNGYATSQITGGNASLTQSGGTVFNVGASDMLTVSTVLAHTTSSADNGLIKSGAGTLILSTNNTYTGATTVSAGTLRVSGAIGNSAVTVAGGTLGGTGSIGGAVTVASGGTLSPGESIGTLSISNRLTLAGTTFVEVNSTNGQSDLVQGVTNLTYGGSLVVSNVAGAGNSPTVGQTFQIFSVPATFSGNFTTITPALTGGNAWSFNPTNGVLSVVASVNTNPTNLTASVTSGTLNLSWPADHTGWRLLVQTNNLAAGISVNTNDWATVAGSSATNQVALPVDSTKPAEFYRLVYP